MSKFHIIINPLINKKLKTKRQTYLFNLTLLECFLHQRIYLEAIAFCLLHRLTLTRVLSPVLEICVMCSGIVCSGLSGDMMTGTVVCRSVYQSKTKHYYKHICGKTLVSHYTERLLQYTFSTRMCPSNTAPMV